MTKLAKRTYCILAFWALSAGVSVQILVSPLPLFSALLKNVFCCDTGPPACTHKQTHKDLVFCQFQPQTGKMTFKGSGTMGSSLQFTLHTRYYVNRPARLISLAPVSLEAVQSSTHLVRALGAPLLVFHHHQAAPLLCMETNTVLFSLRIITTTEPWQMISS